MRRVSLLPIIFLVVLGSYAFTAFIQGPGRIIPITGITHFIDGVILVGVGLMLLRHAQSKLETVSTAFHFSIFFLAIGVFQMLMGVPHLTLFGPADLFPMSMNWGFIDGHIFLYASLAFFVLVPTKIFFPKLGRIPFWIIAAFGSWITLVNIFNPGAPVFDYSTGITFLNVHPSVGMLIPIIAIVSWIPAAILFAVQAFRSHDPLVRRRGILFAVGLAIITFAGPLHDISRSAISFLAADIFTMAGFLIMVGGVLTEADMDSVSAVNTVAS